MCKFGQLHSSSSSSKNICAAICNPEIRGESERYLLAQPRLLQFWRVITLCQSRQPKSGSNKQKTLQTPMMMMLCGSVCGSLSVCVCVCVCEGREDRGGAVRQASERRFMSGSVCSYISAVIIDINSRLTDRQSD